MHNRIRAAVAALVTLALSACLITPAPEPTGRAHQAVITPTCITIQRSGSSGTVADAWIRSDSTGANGGTTSPIWTGFNGTSYRRSFVSFDLSTIPAGSTITSASLGLYGLARSGTPVITLHTVTSGWTETGVTWSSIPGYGTSALATISSVGGAVSTTLPTGTVQSWLDTPSSNFGVALESDGGGVWQGASSEASTVSQRPKLDVCFTTPSCSDGIQNQGETGVDCGGPCPACPVPDAGSDAGLLADGSPCSTNTECASGICGAGLCRPVGGESVALVTTCSAPASDTSNTGTAIAYGTDPAQMLTLYVPAGTPPSGGWPVVVNVHGGGFTSTGGGRDASPLVTFCQAMVHSAALGGPKACASIDYRLMTYPTNVYPAAVSDGLAAQAWLVSNASTYAINTARMAWIGYSAGGHIAGRVAQAGGVKLLVLWYANAFFEDPSAWGGSFATNPSGWSAYNPAGYNLLGCAAGATACANAAAPAVNLSPAWGSPSVLQSHCMTDSVVSYAQSQRYQTAARAAGVNDTLVSVSGACGHGAPPIYGGLYLTSTCTLLSFLSTL